MTKKDTVKNSIKDLVDALTQKQVVFDVEMFDIFAEPSDKDPDGFLKESHYEFLQPESFQKIITHIKGEVVPGTLYSDLYKSLVKAGLMKMKPSIIYAGSVPKLMFRRDHFLSWFRGYSFQVSSNAYGQGDLGSSQRTMSWELRVAEYLPEPLQHVIAFSHALEAANMYDDFHELLTTNEELVNEFMRVTNDDEEIYCKDFSLEAIKGLIQSAPTSPGTPLAKIAMCSSNNHGERITAYVAIGENFVSMCDVDTGVWRYIPFDKYTDTPEELQDYVYEYDYTKTLLYRLIWILIWDANMYLNFMWTNFRDRKRTGAMSLERFKRLIFDSSEFTIMTNSSVYYQTVDKIVEGMEKKPRY